MKRATLKWELKIISVKKATKKRAAKTGRSKEGSKNGASRKKLPKIDLEVKIKLFPKNKKESQKIYISFVANCKELFRGGRNKQKLNQKE